MIAERGELAAAKLHTRKIELGGSQIAAENLMENPLPFASSMASGVAGKFIVAVATNQVACPVFENVEL